MPFFHNRIGVNSAFLFLMARKLLIRTSNFPYHITGRSNNKEFFYLSNEMLWKIFMETMEHAQARFGCNFHAFVLMSNHYHLLVTTPKSNIDAVMQYIQRDVAKKANQNTSRINHFFGGPYKWSIVYEETYYWNALKYILRNPVRAGMCACVCEYKYSSLNTNPENFAWRMTDFFNDQSKPIILDSDWLNEPFMNELEQDIRLALRRKEFKIPINKKGYRSQLDMPLPKK